MGRLRLSRRNRVQGRKTLLLQQPSMSRLAGIPTALLSLHPLTTGHDETALHPLVSSRDEYCRLCSPSTGVSIHLLGHIQSNSMVMIIYPGLAGGPIWRIHIHMDLWLSGELQRSVQGVEPLLEFHPLGWASPPHVAMMDKWGSEHGVQVAAVPGLSRRLFIWKPRQE